MDDTINAKQLRASLPQIVARVRRGARYVALTEAAPPFESSRWKEPPSPSVRWRMTPSTVRRPWVGAPTVGPQPTTTRTSTGDEGGLRDTSGWLACVDGADPAHGRARDARDELMRAGASFVTTDYVADETLTLLRKRLGVGVAEAWWSQVESSPRVRWEWIRRPSGRAGPPRVLAPPGQVLVVHRLHQPGRRARAADQAGARDRPPLRADGLPGAPDSGCSPPPLSQRDAAIASSASGFSTEARSPTGSPRKRRRIAPRTILAERVFGSASTNRTRLRARASCRASRDDRRRRAPSRSASDSARAGLQHHEARRSPRP